MVNSVPRVIPPGIGPDNQFFWDGVREGRLLIQRCASCGRLRHPPGPMCPVCHSLEWDTFAASGRGRIHSWIVSRHPTEPDDEPRIVVLVELDEGVRLVSNVVGASPSEVANDLAVEVTFETVDGDVVLPQFRLLPRAT